LSAGTERLEPPSTRWVFIASTLFDQRFRSRFDWLRGQPDELATPPIFITFDVLYRAGKDVTDRPLQDRRVLLEDAVAGGGT
jgi:ATP-dependent DNA ligase